jgi:LysR family hydrogen peroxide-inducible transcriptional activator
MNFNQLEYIVSVDRHRNFAKAADECDIAQSTLSREIQRLEKEFKIMIFDRSRHPVVPTLKGIDLINQAKKFLKNRNILSASLHKRIISQAANSGLELFLV